jgi:hypothetical protein
VAQLDVRAARLLGVAERSSPRRSISPCSASSARSASSGRLADAERLDPERPERLPFMARSSAISSVARSSSGSASRSWSTVAPSALAMARRSVSFGSRFPVSIIDS